MAQPEPAATASARAQQLAALLREAERALSHDTQVAGRLAREAATLARELDDRRARARARYLEGRAAETALDETAALEAYREALAAFEAERNDAGRADALRGIGNVYDTLGDSPQALAHHLRALAVAEALGDQRSQATTMRTIGVVHSRAGRPEIGLEWYRSSLELTAPDDAAERSRTLNNIGINLKNLGRLDESLATLETALAGFRSCGHAVGQAASLNNLGKTLERMGRYEESEARLAEALRLARASGYVEGVVNASLTLGRLCDRARRDAEALASLDAALAAARQHGLRASEAEAHDALAALHERSGASERALVHLRASHAIERALMSEASDRQLKSLSIRYQLSAAQREADLLRAKQQELATANARLEALNVDLAAADAQKSRLLIELERETREDSLTGLANRRRLDERLVEEFERATRYGRALTVAIADLDHFKDVNDRYTHVVGDEVLKAVGRVLSASVRHTDLVARYGGEEFVLLLVETGEESAGTACEKVRLAIERHDWESLRPGLAITASLGWCSDTRLADGPAMLAAADAALYRAKAMGRNRVMAA
ncbi:MAG: tetratricopeptide repeat-containing diguanylate cyclase [Burkholderiales bacterium]